MSFKTWSVQLKSPSSPFKLFSNSLPSSSLLFHLPFCRGEFLGGIYLHTQIVNETVNQTQTPDNYVENPRREKSRRREFSLNQIDYKEFSIFYYTFYLQGPLSCKGGRDRLYSWGLMSWVVASEIFASDQPTIATVCNAQVVISWGAWSSKIMPVDKN